MRRILKKWRGTRAKRYLVGKLSTREYAFAKEWEKMNNNGSIPIVDHLCSPYNPQYVPTCSDHDRILANTIIQWLGTNVGQGFLEVVNRAITKERDQNIRRRKKKCPEKMRCLTEGDIICKCDFDAAMD